MMSELKYSEKYSYASMSVCPRQGCSTSPPLYALVASEMVGQETGNEKNTNSKMKVQ